MYVFIAACFICCTINKGPAFVQHILGSALFRCCSTDYHSKGGQDSTPEQTIWDFSISAPHSFFPRSRTRQEDHYRSHICEGESNENLKIAIKIRNTARLSCKLTKMILIV